MECLEEDQGGREPDPEEKRTDIHLLNLLILKALLSQHDSASFHPIQCVCLCVYLWLV